MVHFSYLDTSQFLEKLNRYTSIEAEEALGRGQKSSIRKALRGGARESWQRFLRGGGFRAGWRGFYLCSFMVLYRFAVQAKLKELTDLNGRAGIEAGYHVEAERILDEYLAWPGNEAEA